MTTYGELRLQVQRLLNDVKDVDVRQYDDADIYDGLSAAHRAILPWVPKQLVSTITSGSDGVTHTLPGGIYRIDAVLDKDTDIVIPKGALYPSAYRGNSVAGQNSWVDYPTGYLSLLYENTNGVTVYYQGYWNMPTTSGSGADDFVLEVPDVALAGIVFYACSVCLIPRAVTSASIRQFNVKIDSGDPTDNPLQELSDYFLKRFMQEMKMMPMSGRSS
jgi:hypothetical protein